MPEQTDKPVKIENQIDANKIGYLAPVDITNNKALQVFVKDNHGKSHVMEVVMNALILNLKEQVMDELGFPVLEQRLSFQGKDLDDHQTIQEAGLQQDCTLELFLRLNGGIGEYGIIEKFLEANIKHSNVRKKTNLKSDIAIAVMRGKDISAYTRQIRTKLNYKNAYQNNRKLQDLCARSILVESLGGGNCLEMAEWAAVNLIESTTRQYVYICNLKGQFPLDPNIKLDPKHPLYDPDYNVLNNDLDHVMVITYPDDVLVNQMDIDKATVVDPWYNNLVCSLKDYMATKHPYYNYEYSTNKKLTLSKGSFNIRESYRAKGSAFATPNSKKRAITASDNLATDIYNRNKNYKPNYEHKYEFDVEPLPRDERSTENLEQLLLKAGGMGLAGQEIDSFMEDTFIQLLKSNNEQVLTYLYDCMEENDEYDQFQDLCYALVKASTAAFDWFAKLCTTDYVQQFFDSYFFDYKTTNTLTKFLENQLGASTQKAAIVKALPGEQFKKFLLSAPENCQAILAIGAAKDKATNCLKNQTMTNEDWTNFFGLCSKEQAKQITDKLTQLDQATGQLAVSKLPNDKR